MKGRSGEKVQEPGSECAAISIVITSSRNTKATVALKMRPSSPHKQHLLPATVLVAGAAVVLVLVQVLVLVLRLLRLLLLLLLLPLPLPLPRRPP